MTILKTKEKIKTKLTRIGIGLLATTLFLKPLDLEENAKGLNKNKEQKTYTFYINLPSFKNILIENDKAIDSAVICPGAYRRRTPLLKVEKNYIIIRPYFAPTPSERGQFKPAKPDITKHPQSPKNPLGRVKVDLIDITNMLIRMHGTSLDKSIGKMENGKVIDYKFASNGCIRNDNISFERMIGKIIKNSKIEKVSGAKKDSVLKLIQLLKENKINYEDVIELSPLGHSAIVHLEPKFNIEVRYRLWEIISFKENKMIVKIFVDLYDYLDNKRPVRKLKNLEENDKDAYNFEHFKRDLQRKKINLSQEKIKNLWQQMKSKIEKNKDPGALIELDIK